MSDHYPLGRGPDWDHQPIRPTPSGPRYSASLTAPVGPSWDPATATPETLRVPLVPQKDLREPAW